MQTISIDTTPKADEVWPGLGGNFDSLNQVINEFVDNSISNFDGNNPEEKSIYIQLKQLPNSRVQVSIEDTGTGIKDINAAFTLGCRSISDSPLNEHGFGLKHALACANPENDKWSVATRTADDLAHKRYTKIQAPYSFSDFKAQICDVGESPWEGRCNTTGTLVMFECSEKFYRTLAKGIRGGLRDFKSIAALLYEDLGFVYADIIEKARACITLKVITIDGKCEHKTIAALKPNWVEMYGPGKNEEEYDLGSGNVTIAYQFGLIDPPIIPKEGKYGFDNSFSNKYYKASILTSGVEIRINGRLLGYNLFREIWGLEPHNAYNQFLAIIDIKSDDASRLPKTVTTKSGLLQGNEQLEKLYSWIKEKVPQPPKNTHFAQHETELFEVLRERLAQYTHVPGAVFDCEHHAFATTGNEADRARIDLFESLNGRVTIYEGKKEKTTMKDVYQLRMYWDGLVYDGIVPSKGVLVADEHPQSVKDMIRVVNDMKDQHGNQYQFECSTWEKLLGSERHVHK